MNHFVLDPLYLVLVKNFKENIEQRDFRLKLDKFDLFESDLTDCETIYVCKLNALKVILAVEGWNNRN